MSATPRTDEAIERWRQGKVNILEELAKLETDLNAAVKAEREALAKMCQAVAEADNAERERIDLAKQLRSEKEMHAACQNECDNLQDQRDLAIRMAKERERERNEARNKAHNYEQGYLTHAARADTLEKERDDMSPDYTGSALLELPDGTQVEYRLSAWKRVSKNNVKFIGGFIKPKEDQQQPKLIDDEPGGAGEENSW